MERYTYGFVYIAIIFFVLSDFEGFSQTKLIDRKGEASFYSEAPVEDIDAHSKEAMSIIDLESGEMVASVSMKSFVFKKSLMQEHFNENYVESDKYPNATFKGKIVNLHNLQLSKEGTHVLDVEGKITIHGVTKPLQCKAELVRKGDAFTASAKFPIEVAEFGIRIPKIVFYNIAEIVDVKLSFSYQSLNP
jgi:hypothetical protein